MLICNDISMHVVPAQCIVQVPNDVLLHLLAFNLVQEVHLTDRKYINLIGIV